MTSISVSSSGTDAICSPPQERSARGVVGSSKPLVSLLMPAYNEATVVEGHLARVCHYMKSLEGEYRWEILVVDDGSTDDTGVLAERFALSHASVRVYHHTTNFGVGQALRFAARHCTGDYVVVLDMDLSYSPDHVEPLLRRIRSTNAKIVLTSPYMRGGQVSNVPWVRRTLSTWANRFLAISVPGHFSTLTSMVRVYDGRFLRSLNLRAMGMDVMPEILYKAQILGARVEEIPAHLDWGGPNLKKGKRRSNMRIIRHTAAIILAGFLFRPVMYFVVPGLAMLVFACYVNAWTLIHFTRHFSSLTQYADLFERGSAAVSAAYGQSPHTFLIGLLALMLAIQLISLGILSLQSKGYFEEVFHLASSIYRNQREVHEPPRS